MHLPFCFRANARLQLVLLWLLVACCSVTAAQDQSSQPLSAEGLHLDGVTLAPFSRPRPGKSLALNAVISNSSTEGRNAVAIAKIDASPDLQAASNVYVPPKGIRSIELRLRVPPTFRPDSVVEISFSLNDPENPQRVLLSKSGTPMIDSLRASMAMDSLITALAIDPDPPGLPEWQWPPLPPPYSYEMAIAARVDADLTRRTLTIDYENLPCQMVDWEGLDVVVIANDRPFRDVAAMSAMKRWLAAGGRAWVMLDLVTAENLRWLLSDGMSCQMIDDVELNKFVMEHEMASPLSVADRTVESDAPIRMRRVTQVGGEVTHVVDGFPAAMWYPIGKGRLLVTTLAGAGWIMPRNSQDSRGDEYQTNYRLQSWAQSLSERLYERRSTATPIDTANVLYPVRHIGNPVLDRTFVLRVVFGFCIALCTVGLLCWWLGKLILIGWLVPLISVAAALPLLVASLNLRQEIPNTSAHVQLIDVQPGSETLQGTQWTATYMSGVDQAKLTADSDSLVTWPRTSEQMDLRRWTWIDHGKWELSSSGWPNGLWRMQTRFSIPPRQLDVAGTLDEKGLTITLPGDVEPLDDAVVQYWAGDPEPSSRLEPGKPTLIAEKHLTLADSWMGTTIVNDEQARRDEFYRQVRATESDLSYPSFPAVLGWTKLWPTPINWNEPRDERGSALVVLPIKLAPVAAGQKVRVPHTVLRSRTFSFEGAFAANFSNNSGWWRQETSIGSKVALRFDIPVQVQPLDAREIQIDMQLRAPQRHVNLSAIVDGRRVLLKEFDSPLSALQVVVTEPAVLASAKNGHVDIELDIANPENKSILELGSQVSNWQVDYLRMNIDGQVAQR